MNEKIKKWYAQSLWTQQMVSNAIRKGILTVQQYEEIVGEPYAESQSTKASSGMSPLK